MPANTGFLGSGLLTALGAAAAPFAPVIAVVLCTFAAGVAYILVMDRVVNRAVTANPTRRRRAVTPRIDADVPPSARAYWDG